MTSRFPSKVSHGDLYSIDFDATSRVIHVRTGGFWSPDDARIFCTHLNRFIHAAHEGDSCARILVDRRGAPVQGATVARILGENAVILRSGDYLALVPGSNLAELQWRRVLVHPGIEIFRKPEDAMAWLTGK